MLMTRKNATIKQRRRRRQRLHRHRNTSIGLDRQEKDSSSLQFLGAQQKQKEHDDIIIINETNNTRDLEEYEVIYTHYSTGKLKLRKRVSQDCNRRNRYDNHPSPLIIPAEMNQVKCISCSDDLKSFVFSDEFVLRMWGVTTTNSLTELRNYENVKAKLIEMHISLYNHFMAFLRGEDFTINSTELMKFLCLFPENIVHKISIAIMVLLYCWKLDADLAFDLYMQMSRNSNICDTYIDIVKNVAFVHLQHQVASEYFDLTALDIIPDELMRLNKEDILQAIYGNTCSFTNNILEILHNLIENTQMATASPSKSNKYKTMWRRLVITIIGGFAEPCRVNSNVFITLLINNLELRIDTDEIFKYKIKGITKSFHVHPEVVNRFNINNQTPKNSSNFDIIDVDVDDVKIIINLLYAGHKEQKDVLEYCTGKVTVAVYKLAVMLGISHVSWFLFRGEPYHQFMTNATKLDMLHILIKEKEENLLKDYQLYYNTYSNKEKLQSLVGLSVDEVKYFIGLTNNNISQLCELQKYLMLAEWATTAVQKEANKRQGCVDEIQLEDESFQSNIAAKFQMVQNCLNIPKLVRAAYGNYSKITLIDLRKYRNFSSKQSDAGTLAFII